MSSKLPEGWRQAPLKDVIERLQNGPFGSLLHRSDYISGGTPLINPANIVAGKLAPDADISVGPDVLDRLPAYVMQPGDVVVGRRGEMGRAALVSDERKQWFCGTGCAFVRPGKALDSKFLAMWFGSSAVRATLENESVGATMSNLSTRILGNLEVLVPPLAEQRRIVSKVEALLAQVNAARERLEKVPVLLRRFRRAVLAKAFRGELVPTEVELAARAGRSFQSAAELLGQSADVASDALPEGWAETKLGEVLSGGMFVDGDWVESKDQDLNGEVRLVQLADVGEGVFRNRSARFLTTEKAAELSCTFLAKGDVLIARMPHPLGRACLFPGDNRPCVTVVDVCIARPDAEIATPQWLMHFINAPQFRASMAEFEKGTTRKRISRSNLGQLPIRVPPVSEQRRIVSRIEALLAAAAKVEAETERQLKVLETAPQVILQKAFSGELVPTEAELAAAEGRAFESASELLARLMSTDAELKLPSPRRGRRSRDGAQAAREVRQPARAARSK